MGRESEGDGGGAVEGEGDLQDSFSPYEFWDESVGTVKSQVSADTKKKYRDHAQA